MPEETEAIRFKFGSADEPLGLSVSGSATSARTCSINVWFYEWLSRS
ncbi:MAG: hypothetical protein QOF10_2107 [Kribbellaceae bacterium]|jgi:hypothetical protein|nr:hypothetical protein [Kribbellaceae bacterium]